MTATLHPRRLTAPTALRLVAAAIDLAIMALPTLTAASVASQRFRVLDRAVGPERVSPADQASLDQITTGLHRTVEWNGWLHVIDGAGLTLSAATLLVAALVTHVGFPTLGGGRSPGKGLTGLRVVAGDGHRATAAQHVVRTVTGPLDLVATPVATLAARVAGRRDPKRRRTGDRLADTRVVRCPRDWIVAPGREPSGTDSPADHPAPTRAQAPPLAAVLALHEQPVTITMPGTGSSSSAGAPETQPSEPLVDIGGRSSVLERTTATSPAAAQPVPAPPLFPVRRLDGSATRSPLARTGATRADMARGRLTSSPDAGWLGGPLDLDRCPLDPEGTATDPDRKPRLVSPGFDALVLPESSLAEGSSSLTRAGRDAQRSLPAPSSPNCS